MKDGYIKFTCIWEHAPLSISADFNPLLMTRNELKQKKLIGVYEDGIGYGNVSVRGPHPHVFTITGSATGHIDILTSKHLSHVRSYNIKKNSLVCCGPIKASSESLSHAILYEINTHINAVIHIHNKPLWAKLLNTIPTTNAAIQYGTPEMAEEIRRLHNETELQIKKIFVMAGHEEGVMSFGTSIDEAYSVLQTFLDAKGIFT